MKDEKTYGFNRGDAESLLSEIEQVDKEFPEIRPRGKGRPCAKEITFVYSIATPSPVTPSDFFSGRNPAECGDVEVDYPLGEPCTDGSLVFAIRDEDTGRYNAIATKNAIMGDPETKDILITGLTSSTTCGIGWTKQSMKVITCDTTPATDSVTLQNTALGVVTSVVDTGTTIDVTYRDVYVCGYTAASTASIATTECAAPCTGECVWTWTYGSQNSPFLGSWALTTACANGCDCGEAPPNIEVPNSTDTTIRRPCISNSNTYDESGNFALISGLGT